MNPLNLDRLAAQHGQKIVQRLVDVEDIATAEDPETSKKKAGGVDNSVTKALGILQENGVYACFLFILAKEKENGHVIVDEMLNLLENLCFGWRKPVESSPKAILDHITENVTTDLERLLLAKDVLEQMLIYARYGAKAR